MPTIKTQEQLTLEDLQKRVEKLEQQNNPSKEVTPENKFKVGEFSEAYLKGLLNQTEQPKPQTKYRKNGSLVFAPKMLSACYACDYDGRIQSALWQNTEVDICFLQRSLVFDNKQDAMLWADKLKMAYGLKQRIVESESQDEYLEYCYIMYDGVKSYTYGTTSPIANILCVSTNAKDILMSDDVSDKEFKVFIEVFSL